MVRDLSVNQSLYHRAQKGPERNQSRERSRIGWAINLESPFHEKLFQPAWLLEIIPYPTTTEIAKLAIDEIKAYRIHCSLSSHRVLQELALPPSCSSLKRILYLSWPYWSYYVSRVVTQWQVYRFGIVRSDRASVGGQPQRPFPTRDLPRSYCRGANVGLVTRQ